MLMINLTFHWLMFSSALVVNHWFEICVKGGLCRFRLRVGESWPHLRGDDFWPTCQPTKRQVNLMENARKATWLWAGVTSAKWHFGHMDAQFFENPKSVKSVYLLRHLFWIKVNNIIVDQREWNEVLLFCSGKRSAANGTVLSPIGGLASWIIANILINIFDATFLNFVWIRVFIDCWLGN
jgi:hypothetical protein